MLLLDRVECVRRGRGFCDVLKFEQFRPTQQEMQDSEFVANFLRCVAPIRVDLIGILECACSSAGPGLAKREQNRRSK